MQKRAHLAELEKCCQTHIYLQTFVLIEPKTSPPKICCFAVLLIRAADHEAVGKHGLRGAAPRAEEPVVARDLREVRGLGFGQPAPAFRRARF